MYARLRVFVDPCAPTAASIVLNCARALQDGKAELTRTIPGKPDGDALTRARRSPLRAAVSAVTAPALARLTAFVNARYPQCRGQCMACFQLIRRYLHGERRGHAMHFDLQALVTAVVSLGARE